MYSRTLFATAVALLATSCIIPPKMAPDDPVSRDDYWAGLSALCGQTLHGKMVSNEAVDADMAGRPMRMTVASCSDKEIRIPFHVGPLEEGGKWDTSRTWVLRKTVKGVQLKHDHRHEDGTPDAVTNYGGESSAAAYLKAPSLYALDFPVDEESITNFRANGLEKSITNVWSIAANGKLPNAANATRFTYTLRRTGENARYFEVAFY